MITAYDAYDRPRRYRNQSNYYSSGFTSYNSTVYGSSWWARLSSFALWILTPVIWILDHPLAACRFAFRYTRKAIAAKRKEKGDGKALQLQKRAPRKGSAENELDAKKHPVLPYELLVKISRELHFTDLISVSHSSKRLRTSLFGVGGLDPGQLEDLRQFTCQGNKKSSCELCGIQTCPVSVTSMEAVHPRVRSHRTKRLARLLNTASGRAVPSV